MHLVQGISVLQFVILTEIIELSSIFVTHTHISQWRAKLYHSAYRYHIALVLFSVVV